jgi:hypothetical protein
VVSVPCSNAVDLLSAAFLTAGDGPMFLQPIHPGNPLLFPNLTGIWRNFQQYRFKKFEILSQPLASSLQSGAYCVSTLANRKTSATTGELQMLPVFSVLLNLATTAVSTIWRPLAYKVAETVLGRLKRYLMSSDDDDNVSPGAIAIDRSAVGTGTGDNSPDMPIFTVNAVV